MKKIGDRILPRNGLAKYTWKMLFRVFQNHSEKWKKKKIDLKTWRRVNIDIIKQWKIIIEIVLKSKLCFNIVRDYEVTRSCLALTRPK